MDLHAPELSAVSSSPRPHSAPPASPPKQFLWNPADSANLAPSRITLTRLYQRAPKAPYHHLPSQSKAPLNIAAPKSPGPQKKKRCVGLHAGPNLLRPVDSYSDASDDDEHAADMFPQHSRSSSAPPEATNTPEHIPAPTVSDDTAILHAFLSRAAASKRPMPVHKRESLENRRDSDAVRHALASADKAEIMPDLDADTPLSPTKPGSPMSHANSEPEPKPELETIPTNQDATIKQPPSNPAKSKAPRRTTRTRTPVAAQTKPAKIAIRSAADHIALKRTEAQELSMLTRSNTRKNKGKAILPPSRLLNINDDVGDSLEFQSESTPPDQVQTEEPLLRKGVQWDKTLAYIKEFESDSPDSPPKTKGRTSRVSARALEPFVPLTSAQEPIEPVPLEDAAVEPIEAEPTLPQLSETPNEPPKRVKAVPVPSKKRSRIATPARPSKIAAIKPPSTTPLLSALPQPPIMAEAQESRLMTPKKPSTLTAIRPTALTSRLELAPSSRHDGAPSVSLPGLMSPAKKRGGKIMTSSAIKSSAAHKDGEPLGLASPAKRKRAGVKFS
jgi:hypothetical protein